MKGFLSVLAILVFSISAALQAEPLDLSYHSSDMRIKVTRAKDKHASAIKVDVTVPTGSDVSVTGNSSTGEIIADISSARIPYHRTLPIESSTVIKSVRISPYPNDVRVTIIPRANVLPEYKWDSKGGVLTIFVAEQGSIAELVAHELQPLSIAVIKGEVTFKTDVNNKSSFDVHKESAREQTFSNHLDVRSELKYVIGRPFQTALGVKINSFATHSEEDSFDRYGDVRLDNAYINFAEPGYNVRLGNQIVTWGKTDEISPLDIINPEDMRDGFVRPHLERKLAIPMANIELIPSSAFKIQGIFVPTTAHSRINLFEDDWGYFGNIAPFPVQVDNASGVEAGARVSSRIQGLDFSLYYLSAPSPLPSLKSVNLPAGFGLSGVGGDLSLKDVGQLVEALGQPLGLEYNRRNLAGFDFETTLENIGIRGDFAYISKEDFFTDNLLAKESPVINYVLGFDYSSASEFYINVQYSQTYITDYTPSILLNKRVTNQVFSEISQPFLDNQLKLGFRFLYDFTNPGGYYSPYLLMSFFDNLLFEVGAEFIDADKNTLIGSFNNNDQVYLIIKGTI